MICLLIGILLGTIIGIIISFIIFLIELDRLLKKPDKYIEINNLGRWKK